VKKTEATTMSRLHSPRDNSRLLAALEGLALGLRPIPVREDSKVPHVTWREFEGRAPSEDEVVEWWSRWPGANLAFLTGEPSGIDVIDVDVAEPAWPRPSCILPSTCVVSTPRGGVHYYLKHTPGVGSSVSSLADGVDVRADGGYIIAPPSAIGGRSYRFVQGSLSDVHVAPAWLRDELLGTNGSRREFVGLRDDTYVVPEGSRNTMLTSLAGTLRRRGLDEGVLAPVLQTLNTECCAVPLPREEVERIARSVSRYVTAERGRQGHRRPPTESLPGASGQGEELTRLCEQHVHGAFQDQLGESYVLITVGNHIEMKRTSSRAFREEWMASLYRRHTGRPPSAEALRQARIQVESWCAASERRVLYDRVAWYEGCLYYDLSDSEWRAVRISPEGWSIVPSPPIFRRSVGQVSQVVPSADGSFEELWRNCNVLPSQQPLLLSLVASWFVPDIPHPILVLHGEPGSGKSTTARRLKQLVDPSVSPLLSIPRKEQDLLQTLDHNWVVPFDNINKIPAHASDTLCRAVTGEGRLSRKLYTDDEDFIRAYRRCLILNGIGNPASGADLLDRAVILGLQPIREPLPETVLDAGWADNLPGLLGCFMDGLASAMRLVSRIESSGSFRMADFAIWGEAFSRGVGFASGHFSDCYNEANLARWQDAAEANAFTSAVLSLLSRCGGVWVGTATELMDVLRADAGNESAFSLPGSPKGVSTELERWSGALRHLGIVVKRNKGTSRLIRLSSVA